MKGGKRSNELTTTTQLDYRVEKTNAVGLIPLKAEYTSAVVTDTSGRNISVLDMFEPENSTSTFSSILQQPLAPLKMLESSSLTKVYSPNGELAYIEELDAFIDPVVQHLLESGEIDETYLPLWEDIKRGYEYQLLNLSHQPFMYPDYAVEIGDTWTKTLILQSEPPMKEEIQITYTLVERQDGIVIIEIEIQGSVENVPQEELEQVVSGYPLDQEPLLENYKFTGEGHMQVDEATGWPIFMQLTHNISSDTETHFIRVFTSKTIR